MLADTEDLHEIEGPFCLDCKRELGSGPKSRLYIRLGAKSTWTPVGWLCPPCRELLVVKA